MHTVFQNGTPKSHAFSKGAPFRASQVHEAEFALRHILSLQIGGLYHDADDEVAAGRLPIHLQSHRWLNTPRGAAERDLLPSIQSLYQQSFCSKPSSI